MEGNLLELYGDAVYTKNGRKYPNVDCWGFVHRVLQNRNAANIPLRKNSVEYKTPSEELIAFGHLLVEVKTAEVGTLIGLFRGKLLSHVGIMYTNTKVLHLSKAGIGLVNLKNFPKPSQTMKLYKVKSHA